MNDKKHKDKDKEKEYHNEKEHKESSEYEVTQHTEGALARAIERRTARLPSDLFLWAALASIGASCVLEMTGRQEKAHWVGQWVAPFLLFGVYNKIVKVAGSDRMSGSGL